MNPVRILKSLAEGRRAGRHFLRCRPTFEVHRFSSQEATEEKPVYYRTFESDPRNHGENHLGRIYSIPEEEAKLLGVDDDRAPYQLVGPLHLQQQKLFGEHSFMVRRPAVEIMEYLKQLKAKGGHPCTRFVLWGQHGCGKTSSLAHIQHFCFLENYVALNFHKIKDWFTIHKDLEESKWKVGRIDHSFRSQQFLADFKVLNSHLLSDLAIHKTYIWSDKEKTDEGSSLMDLVNQGIERPTFSADCLAAVLSELKLNCAENRCRLAIMVDGVNTIFERKSLINPKLPKRTKGPFNEQAIAESLDMNKFTIVRSLKKLFSDDNLNTVVVASVDASCSLEPTPGGFRNWWYKLQNNMVPSQKYHFPFALLGQEGWETMGPFLPVEVEPYSKGELDTMIDYYADKRFIRAEAATEAGRAEVHFLTGRNPKDFMNYSNWW